MIKITLYNTTSQDNVIGKELTNATDFNIVLKGMTTVDNPVIKFQTNNNLTGFNYAYIPAYDRYYFINDIEVYPNNIFILHLSIDVLETYKDSILNGKALITKASKYNDMYNGGDYNTLITQENTVYKSDVVLPEENNMILVTMGAIK